MIVHKTKDGCSVWLGDIEIIRHEKGAPVFFAGTGYGESNLYRGNFKVLDRTLVRYPLAIVDIDDSSPTTTIIALNRVPESLITEVLLHIDKSGTCIRIQLVEKSLNRFWLRLINEPEEHIWGGGEQFSHFCLTGRRFPMWTQEPGVGRDPTTRMALIAENDSRAGAHDTATYYPQPTFISSRHYALHIDSSAYSVLDFTSPMFHEIEIWDSGFSLDFYIGTSLEDIVKQLAQHFGHGGQVPEWVYQGAILGLKRGMERNLEVLEQALNAGVLVSGLWCEDWCGLRHTSFGARLFWDWQWNETRYPGLPQQIQKLRERGIRFLAYNNPNLCSDGPLFKEAAEQQVLTTNTDGSPYTIDFGEFECGFVDFTSESGRRWYKDRIIKRSMLDLGISGWMADFGEYQPTDMRVASGEDGWKVHNQWPTLWAQVNAEAISEAGLSDDVLFFMRSGYTGSQRYCKLMWAGDQLVDFSRHDGLETAICAALSCGLVGNTVSHSDVGGYTTLYGNVRTEEVFMRWAEMNAFTPVMRTHESNRPDESFQFYQSDKALAHFARMTRIYVALTPYLRTLSAEATATGLPIQRPLVLHYEQDKRTWKIHDQYLYGRDLLIAPVHKSGVTRWRAYLPTGTDWVHLWSGQQHIGGQTVEVDAPFGNPPVFFRTGSEWEKLFISLRNA